MSTLTTLVPPLPSWVHAVIHASPLHLALGAVAAVLLLRVLAPAPPWHPEPGAVPSRPQDDYNWRPTTHPPCRLWRSYTSHQLAPYDGTDPDPARRPLLLAIRRKVYDVSPGQSFYGPGGPYAIFAGRDASRGLAKQSFAPEMLTPLDGPIDPLDDLSPAEWAQLRDWEELFTTKYTQCGDLVPAP